MTANFLCLDVDCPMLFHDLRHVRASNSQRNAAQRVSQIFSSIINKFIFQPFSRNQNITRGEAVSTIDERRVIEMTESLIGFKNSNVGV